MLGFRFPQNFDAPYTAASLQDFWRRWHMTLSRWLRDYLYISLGGSRGGRLRTYRNLLLTMVLGGLWHGAAWTFVVWGALHGLGLAVERWWDERRHPAPAPDDGLLAFDLEAAAPGAGYGTVLVEQVMAQVAAAAAVPRPTRPRRLWLRRLATFHLVCLGWVFFRAGSLEEAFDVLGRIAGGASSVPLNPMVVIVVVAMLASQFVPPGSVTRWREAFAGWGVPAQAVALAGVLVVVDVLGPEGVAPFIYFQF